MKVQLHDGEPFVRIKVSSESPMFAEPYVRVTAVDERGDIEVCGNLCKLGGDGLYLFSGVNNDLDLPLDCCERLIVNRV